jgi:CDP-glucose 4,6-dehydratase
MGGHDPYSSSKACSELVTAAYRRSFLAPRGVHIATARAGNVIGGGDWAADRLIPDFLRALDKRQTLVVRSPHSTRPWQHVLEPLSGYLLLAKRLLTDGTQFAEAWNFGPHVSDSQSVQWIVNHLCQRTHGATWRAETASQSHEAISLTLDSSKALRQLGWQPRWTLATALKHTLDWHIEWRSGQDMQFVSLKQISAYSNEKSRVES